MSECVSADGMTGPQRRLDVSRFGMWVFLASEALFFGAMLLSFLISRLHHPQAFAAAAQQLSFWLGTINTAVLLTSSLSMALAEIQAEEEKWRQARRLLLITIALGVIFVVIKFTEYREEFLKGLIPFIDAPFHAESLDGEGTRLFFDFYFALTGLHALHLAAGAAVIGAICWRWPRTEGESRLRRVVAMALYWHFVDVVWVFLYPVLYLIK